jgi:uncharacterized protein (TIGR00369 family)
MNKVVAALQAYRGKVLDTTISKAGQWLQYSIVNVSAGEVEISLNIRPEMCNPLGNIHGGMISMIMDEVCGLAHFTLDLETFYTSVNLHVNFLYSAAQHETIIASAKTIRSGKNIANIDGIIKNQQGQVIATASTNLFNTQKNVFELLSL